MKVTIYGGHTHDLREKALYHIGVYFRAGLYEQLKLGRYHAALFTTPETKCEVWKTKSGGVTAMIVGREAKQ